jgi:hypothetical protein
MNDYNLAIFEIVDGKVNLTRLCKELGKDIKEWMRNKSTNAFISALEAARGNSPQLEIKNGVGTFGTREVALRLAQWVSPEFEVFCINKLDTLFQKGAVSLSVNPVQPIKKSNIGLLKEMVAELELQAMRIDQVESEVFELRTQIRTIDSKPDLNITVTTAKAFKTLKQDKLDEIGREINQLVFRLFKTGDTTFQDAHSEAHNYFKMQTGQTYVGAKNSSYQSKLQFLEWLKKI